MNTQVYNKVSISELFETSHNEVVRVLLKFNSSPLNKRIDYFLLLKVLSDNDYLIEKDAILINNDEYSIFMDYLSNNYKTMDSKIRNIDLLLLYLDYHYKSKIDILKLNEVENIKRLIKEIRSTINAKDQEIAKIKNILEIYISESTNVELNKKADMLLNPVKMTAPMNLIAKLNTHKADYNNIQSLFAYTLIDFNNPTIVEYFNTPPLKKDYQNVNRNFYILFKYTKLISNSIENLYRINDSSLMQILDKVDVILDKVSMNRKLYTHISSIIKNKLPVMDTLVSMGIIKPISEYYKMVILEATNMSENHLNMFMALILDNLVQLITQTIRSGSTESDSFFNYLFSKPFNYIINQNENLDSIEDSYVKAVKRETIGYFEGRL